MTVQPFTRQESYVRGLQRAHARGKHAADSGQPIADNPYERGDYRRSWEDGWREGAA